MRTFPESQVVRLAEAGVRLGVTPTHYLAEGVYNQVWDVRSSSVKLKNKPLVMRISHQPIKISEIQDELTLYKTMHNLKIGLPFVNGFIKYETKDTGTLAIVYQKADGTLTDYLRGDIKYKASAQDMVLSTVRAILDTSKANFFCGDIKAENMLVANNEVFMADFDPVFCQQNTWIPRLCKVVGSGSGQGCHADHETVENIKDLLSRVMIFQLYICIKKYSTGNDLAKRFNEELFRQGVKSMKKPLRDALRLKGAKVSPLEVIKQLLGDEMRYDTRVLNHYSQTRGTIYTREFQDVISNFMQAKTPKLRSLKMHSKDSVEKSSPLKTSKTSSVLKTVTKRHKRKTYKKVNKKMKRTV
jgi:hypothetical protein